MPLLQQHNTGKGVSTDTVQSNASKGNQDWKLSLKNFRGHHQVPSAIPYSAAAGHSFQRNNADLNGVGDAIFPSSHSLVGAY